MADRVYPASKPPPAMNGGASASAAATNGVAPPPAVAAPPGAFKPQIYNPSRQPYRPQPRRARRKRCTCCCFLFWFILLVLILALVVAIAGTAFWVLYRPHRPTFAVSNFRLGTLNLTTNSDASVSHLATALNLTLTTTNPNKKIRFFYDDFNIKVLSSSGVLLANGSAAGFESAPKDVKVLKLVSGRKEDLDAGEAADLKSDLKKNGVAMKLKAETRVRVKIDKMKTKKVTVRVTCDGIKGTVPAGRTPTVASTANAKCQVDLRFKIWKFTF